MLKRIITSLFCLLLIFVSIPLFGLADFFAFPVYAFDPADIPDGYEQVNSNEQLAQSFQAYCKSRDSNITSGNILGADLRWIYGFMVKASQGLGININDIQNQLFYKYETNAGLRFFVTSTGIQFYNDLFAYLIQNEGLSVGDENVDKSLYSGEEFIDDDGNRCFVYKSTIRLNNVSDVSYRDTFFSEYGTFLKYDSNDFITLYNQGTNAIYHVNNGTYDKRVYHGPNSGMNNYFFGWAGPINSPSYGILYGDGSSIPAYRGYATVVKDPDGRRYFGVVSFYGNTYSFTKLNSNPMYDIQTPTTVNINFVSNKINNNHYEGDTYITNEGDVINNPPAGGKDPGWDVGGGQGSYNDGNGNSYTINFPDFELPDLNIDWSIQGLGNKFPFSIPFDIASLVAVLNADPEAPRFQGTMDLGITTYNYDIDLSQFDTVASACRIAELLLLVFGLIMITRSIIKG